MNRRNYRKELDKIIEESNGIRPSLMLHACCGPCSSSVLEQLADYFDVTVLWYNPNLYPESEYSKRLSTLREVIDKMQLTDRVKLIVLPWDSENYYSCVKGLEGEPEGGKRCGECFALRLQKTAELATKENYDFFCTTLTVSRHKNAVLINSIGEEIGKTAGVKWLPGDFKKRGGEDRSQQLSRLFGIYQQLYCGCEFSLNKTKGAENERKEN